MKSLSVILLLLVSVCFSFSFYPKDDWWILGTTTEESAYDDDGSFYWKVTFSDKVKKLAGKKIVLKGYFYSYQDTSITLFTKNKQPFYGCSADPKITMIELKGVENMAIKLNKRYQLEGILELNESFHESDSYTFPYRITQVKIK